MKSKGVKMETLYDAIKLREEGQVEAAISILKSLVKQYPENADVNYQLAWCYDVLTLEREAVPFYEKAISIGLSTEDQIEAIIGLGSTYRTIGEYEKSKELLQNGVERYDNKAMAVFLAMTLYNLNEHEQSMGMLLKLIAETSSDMEIRKFKKAIYFYSDKLNEII